MRVTRSRAITCGVSMTVLLATDVARAERPDAKERGCQTVEGQIIELEVPANEVNNPVNHGRVVGPVTGALKGAVTSILTGGATPPPGASLAVTTQNVFVTKDGDMLVASGLAVLTFNADGTVKDDATLTVLGAASTGKFAGATGTIELTGTGFNFGGGPGVGRFEFDYRGEICGITHLDDGP
jgi:hypothetical protein